MKKLLASALLAFSFLVSPAYAETKCLPGNNYEEMYNLSRANKSIKLFEESDSAREKHQALANKRREANGMAKYPPVSRIIWVIVEDRVVVKLYDADDCAFVSVPLDFDIMIKFFADAGITDSEVTQVTGA